MKLTSVIVFALAAGAAAAQSGPPPTAAQREHFKACVDEEESLQAQRLSLIRRHDEHKLALKSAQDEIAAHMKSASGVNKDDAAAVAAFNARQGELDGRGADLNAQGDQLNREQLRFNARIADANKRCNGMIFSHKERDAIRRENAGGGK
ncbi:hypothetical protein ACHMW6_02705 [Pseudoduganella sp. UC29_106]|uniref:hypothetical protein n=1 Tax=Pseudoduganella sp. UC29_106 TaxID=3374553 RepID=UPI00375702C5